jgi:pimeloyl-ACP methyl ester carboxylesterase
MMALGNGFDDFFYTSTDGLRLHARIYGKTRPGVLPAICLAGLTRNAADFHDLALHLANHPRRPRQVVAFDYRGRGRSAYDSNWKNYDVLIETGDILAGLTAIGIEHGAFIGTSRGGIIIHVLAAMRPAALKAVVLNDIGPVVEGAGLAQIKAYLDRAPKPTTFTEAVAISKGTQGDTFSALTDADWERMVRAYYREENGRLVADFDPALLNTMQAVDLSKPLPVLWPQFQGLTAIPMLAIRGENSQLMSNETLEEMAKRHPRCETITVPGQGHAPLLETGMLPERIASFIEKSETH